MEGYAIKHRNVSLNIIIAALLLFMSTACSKRDDKPKVYEPYKIGVALPLTGPAAFMGEGIRDAMLIAQERLMDNKYNYELIFEDSRHDPKVSAALAKKFITVDNVDAIVSVGDESGPVVSPIATKHEVPHFAIAIQKFVARGKYNFTHWTPAGAQTGLLLEELERRGIKKIGIFRSRYAGFLEIYDSLWRQIIRTKIKIDFEQAFEPGAVGFRSLIAKAVNSDSEIYIIFALPPALEILVKQMREAGITAPLTSCESFDATEQPELFEGDWYVSPADASGKFREDFIAKYGRIPPAASGNAYDIFNLIVKAVEDAGSSGKPSPGEVVKKLGKIKNYKGALGELHINKEGMVISRPQLKMIKNGIPVPVNN